MPTLGPSPTGNDPQPEWLHQFKGLNRLENDSQKSHPVPAPRKSRKPDIYDTQITNYRERQANRSTSGFNGTLLPYDVMEDDDYLHVCPRDGPASPHFSQRNAQKFTWPQAPPETKNSEEQNDNSDDSAKADRTPPPNS